MKRKIIFNIDLSKCQCRNLASYFYKDIAKYVEENHARYLQFVESEKKKGEKS